MLSRDLWVLPLLLNVLLSLSLCPAGDSASLLPHSVQKALVYLFIKPITVALLYTVNDYATIMGRQCSEAVVQAAQLSLGVEEPDILGEICRKGAPAHDQF